MRTKVSFDKNWMYKIGEIGIPPKTGAKSAMIGGLTSSLPNENGELFPGADRAMGMLASILPSADKGKEEKLSPAVMLMSEYARKEHSLEGWKKVDLPHDFRLELGFNDEAESFSQGYIPNGICYYRKVFSLPKEDEGKRIVLEFDGVMRSASFWLNGCFLGDSYSGYCGFQFDITEMAHYGEAEGDNVLLVRVDTTTGNEGWWYEGGGIYRHTWITKYAPVHVDRWGVYVKTKIREGAADAVIETTVRNETNEVSNITVHTILTAPDGSVAAEVDSMGSVQAEKALVLITEVTVEAPLLWDCENPNLYTAKTEILTAGEVIDSYDTTFGFRSVEYTTEGLFLNGKRFPIYGACVHQDFAGVGTALPDAVQDYKIRRLRDMGCNAYRSSHNPATIELLDVCDRQGVLVLDENRLIETTPHRLRDLEELIKRGRNHPSIFAWSLSNEEMFSGSEMAMRIIKRLIAAARRLDNTRPFVAAEAFIAEDAAIVYGSEIYDVLGLNYAEAVGMGAKERFARIHAKRPEMPILNTENTSWFTTRGIYEDNPKRGHCSSYGTRFAMMGGEGGPNAGGTAKPWQSWNFYKENPFTGGFFIWTGFDYRGEPTPLRETQVTANFGVMDLCGFPKDDYYYYQSVFTDKPVLHIMPHWNWEKEGEIKQIRLYTNCDEAELFLNDRSIGRKSKEEEWISFDVAYEPGTLRAVGYRNGEKAAEDIRITAQKAAKVRLSADTLTLEANGRDVAFITAEVCDENGVIVPVAENELYVTVEGQGVLLGLGNGDPGSRESDKSTHRHAFSGKMMVLTQSGEVDGEIKITVNGQDIEGDTLFITVQSLKRK